jgi:hypothetical protein
MASIQKKKSLRCLIGWSATQYCVQSASDPSILPGVLCAYLPAQDRVLSLAVVDNYGRIMPANEEAVAVTFTGGEH